MTFCRRTPDSCCATSRPNASGGEPALNGEMMRRGRLGNESALAVQLPARASMTVTAPHSVMVRLNARCTVIWRCSLCCGAEWLALQKRKVLISYCKMTFSHGGGGSIGPNRTVCTPAEAAGLAVARYGRQVGQHGQSRRAAAPLAAGRF